MTPAAMLRAVLATPGMTPEAMLRDILALPGLTGAHLLSWADHADAVGQQINMADDPAGALEVYALAAAMREAAPRFPTPPLVPANAVEAA